MSRVHVVDDSTFSIKWEPILTQTASILFRFPFYRIPILPRKNSNAFQLFSISICRKTDVLVSKSLLFDKLFLKIFPFSRKLSNLPTESPFYRKPILPRKNSSVFRRNFVQNPHFIEFPFYRECTVLRIQLRNAIQKIRVDRNTVQKINYCILWIK